MEEKIISCIEETVKSAGRAKRRIFLNHLLAVTKMHSDSDSELLMPVGFLQGLVRSYNPLQDFGHNFWDNTGAWSSALRKHINVIYAIADKYSPD